MCEKRARDGEESWGGGRKLGRRKKVGEEEERKNVGEEEEI